MATEHLDRTAQCKLAAVALAQFLGPETCMSKSSRAIGPLVTPRKGACGVDMSCEPSEGEFVLHKFHLGKKH